MSRRTAKQIFRVVLLAAFIIVPLALILFGDKEGTETHLELKPFKDMQIASLLATLAFISLLVERAIEVFVYTLREPETEKMEDNVETMTRQIKNYQTRGLESTESAVQTREKIEEKKEELRTHKTGTQVFSLVVGLLMGLLMAIVGFSTLKELIAADPATVLTGYKLDLFNWMDILLTAAVIAGGSNGIHRLMKVYANFMDQAAKSAKDDEEE